MSYLQGECLYMRVEVEEVEEVEEEIQHRSSACSQ